MFKGFISVLLMAGFLPVSSYALDAIPRGQLQLQASYYEPTVANDAHWAISMPNSNIGLTAVESLDNSTIIGHWQVGIDPLSEGQEALLTQQQAFLSWQQGIINLWAGRLPSLEQAFLEDKYQGLLSLSDKGLAVSGQYDNSERNAVRIDAASGEYLVFSGQWIIDENSDALVWSVASSLQTPEGSIAVTYRKPEGRDAIWGNRVTWLSGSLSFSGVWMLQGEVLGWDVEARMSNAKTQSFLGFSKDLADENRWSVGVQQMLSPAVTNYSELLWWSDAERWQWSTGFQMRF
ncbi:hypothetical protein [Reinekea sp. G2M2-21]|uniref:hypothetical protein n=1 Tax=Reinekea sp. G2M2-21 TaxID=2788942 RepID=UPI0018AAB4B4|nr:hypothetical protein [Reinekea sp. G2M2-21]